MLSADLSGRTLLVTGAASGIGLATAERFARCGARVAINHLPDDPRGPEAVARLRTAGLDAVGAPGDIGDPAAVPAMVDGAVAALGGRLDWLVNNAGTAGGSGVFDYSRLDLMTEAFWQTLVSVNLVGLFRVTRAAEAKLRAARGAVVNIASVAGLGLRGSSPVYAATKAGVISLTVSLARGLAPDLRVNAIAPGLVDSPWTKDWPAERKARAVKKTPLGRMTLPEDVADAALFLCAGTRFVTGHTLVVDGGLILGD